jgi:hypothetical protein
MKSIEADLFRISLRQNIARRNRRTPGSQKDRKSDQAKAKYVQQITKPGV